VEKAHLAYPKKRWNSHYHVLTMEHMALFGHRVYPPIIAVFYREHDDNPIDLGEHYFQTNKCRNILTNTHSSGQQIRSISFQYPLRSHKMPLVNHHGCPIQIAIWGAIPYFQTYTSIPALLDQLDIVLVNKSNITNTGSYNYDITYIYLTYKL
jgi:hypothetical protein